MNAVNLLVAGQPVRLVAPWPGPAAPSPAPVAAPVGQQMLPAEPSSPGPGDPRPTAAGPDGLHSEQAQQLAWHMGRSLLEVLQGRRSPEQLGAWLQDDACLVLAAWRRQRSWRDTTLVSVRACRTAPRVVEASLHLRDGAVDDRSRGDGGFGFAATLRLEHRFTRWQLADFQVLLPRALLPGALLPSAVLPRPA